MAASKKTAFTDERLLKETHISSDTLTGQLLIAMPNDKGGIFERSVIYICVHSPQGAMGIILNQIFEDFSFQDVLIQLSPSKTGKIHASKFDLSNVPVHAGGPIEAARGFVLHKKAYYCDSSTLVGKNDICLTSTPHIFDYMATGKNPVHQTLLALGYAGWRPGQLELELHHNIWLTAPADTRLIFECPVEQKYNKALETLGVQIGALSESPGHA